MRKSYQGELCTVKFSGLIPVWDEPALGVEWDNPSRGKHSGSISGQQYFECKIENAGSFLKASKKCDDSHSFAEALISKYTRKHEHAEISLSRAKKVESVGMDKYFDRQKQIENLDFISLSGCCVDRFDIGAAPLHLPSLKQLDLSHNLIQDMGQAIEALSSYQQLESLNLSHNRFSKFDIKSSLPSVTELNLGSTLLDPQQLSTVLAAFPNIKRLGLSRNLYSSYPLPLSDKEISQREKTLEWVDLAYNNLTEIPIHGSQLVLNDNLVAGASFPVYYDCLNLYDQRTSTQMSLSEIDNLVARELWLSEAKYHRAAIIGRLEKLEKLNGTSIPPQERHDCEIYVWSQVQKGEQPPLPLERQRYFKAVYGESRAPPARSIAARLVNISVDGVDYKAIGDSTVQSFLSIVGRERRKRAVTLKLALGGRLLESNELLKDIIKTGDGQLQLIEDPDFLKNMFR